MEKRQDEVVEEKIRKLRKAKNVERRPQDHNVENKRRKLENSEYEEQKGCWGRPGEKKPEKRAEEKEKIENPKIKKMKQTKLGKKIPRKPTPAEMPLESDNGVVDDDRLASGESSSPQEQEMEKLAQRYKNDDRFYDMERINLKRNEAREKLRRLEKDRKDKAKMLEKTWEFARICKEIIEENKGKWEEKGTEDRNKRIERIEKKVING